jgi:hypothetical protein
VASYDVVIAGNNRAKVREPGLVILWSVLTLGIYAYVWYYKINRELRDFGEAQGDTELAKSNPALSVLAVTLGALILVPQVVSYWRCTGRIRRAEAITGRNDPLNGWIIGICYATGIFLLLPLIAIPILVQDHLNAVWKHFPHAPDPSEPATAIAAQLPPPSLEGMAPPSPGKRQVDEAMKPPAPDQKSSS